jgi:long-chain fatty acid transport protein
MSSAKTCAAFALATLVAGATPGGAQGAAPSLDAFGLLVAQQSRPSFAVLGAGARAAGMGGAFTALADDASAASFNPAGLALLLRPEATVVLGGRRRAETHASFTQVEGGETEVYGGSRATDSTVAANFAAFTLPFEVGRRNLSLQVSYHRLIEFDWRASRTLAETEAGVVAADLFQAIDQNGAVDTFSLAGAIQASERLSLGLTLSRWQGGWSFATRTRETERANSRIDQLRFAQQSSWSGWNATLGALLRYRYLNLGAALRTGFEGDYQVDSTLAASFDTPFPERSRFRGELEWPASWTVGVAIKPLQTWFLTVDYAQFDWDDFRIVGLPEGPVNFLDLRPIGSSRTRSTAELRFGSEITFFRGPDLWALRAGHWRAPRAQRLVSGDAGDTLLGWTLGVGWRRGPLTFDLAWQRSSSSTRALEFVDPETVAGGGVEPQAESDVEVIEQRLLLSVLYQFESRVALQRLFHFLFVGPLEPKPAATAPPPAGAARGPR